MLKRTPTEYEVKNTVIKELNARADAIFAVCRENGLPAYLISAIGNNARQTIYLSRYMLFDKLPVPPRPSASSKAEKAMRSYQELCQIYKVPSFVTIICPKTDNEHPDGCPDWKQFVYNATSHNIHLAYDLISMHMLVSAWYQTKRTAVANIPADEYAYRKNLFNISSVPGSEILSLIELAKNTAAGAEGPEPVLVGKVMNREDGRIEMTEVFIYVEGYEYKADSGKSVDSTDQKIADLVNIEREKGSGFFIASPRVAPSATGLSLGSLCINKILTLNDYRIGHHIKLNRGYTAIQPRYRFTGIDLGELYT